MMLVSAIASRTFFGQACRPFKRALVDLERSR
jgi:hypothetical protein